MTTTGCQRWAALAFALAAAYPAAAQQQQQAAQLQTAPAAAPSASPKILILSNRTGAHVEVAGAAATPQSQPQSQAVTLPPAGPAGRQAAARQNPTPQSPGAMPSAPVSRAQPQQVVDQGFVAPQRRAPSRREQVAQQQAANQPAAMDGESSGPPTLEERRRRLAQRSMQSRASQSPAAAGIPVGKGDQLKGSQPRSAVAARGQRGGAAAQAAAPAAAAVAAAPAVAPAPVQPVPPSAPQLARGPVDTSNPLANELVRNGDSYVFRGSLNGKPVQFRLSENAQGLVVPSSLAVMYGLVPPTVVDGKASVDVYTPVQTMSVGAHPVTAVMARVISMKSPYVEVGVDALQAFKVVNENGRRLLIPARSD